MTLDGVAATSRATERAPLITVCTPTYNRADKLPRVHESLCTQIFRNFDWLVIDDGSTDGTAEVVDSLTTRSPFPVHYLRKENEGKHIALNRAANVCNGYFLAILDSDDWYLPHCLERLMYHWNRLPDPTRFAEVQGLCADPHGNVLGDRYPTDPFDADYYTMRQVLQLRGDRKGMIRADVLRAYPFPEEFVGVLVPEAIVLNRIAKSFLIRGFNEVLAQNEYLPDGMTRHRSRLHRENSGPRLLYFEELLDMAQSRPLPPRARWKAYANLTRNGLHQGRPLRIQAARAPSRGWWLGSLPFGALLFVRDLLTGRV